MTQGRVRYVYVWVLLFAGGCFDLGGPAPDAAAIDAEIADTGVADAAQPCTEGVVEGATGTEVMIPGFRVEPSSVTIRAGEVVVWINADDMTHRLVSGEPGDRISVGDGGFDTGSIEPGARRAIRFCSPRSLPYYCAPHAGQMNGFRLEIVP